MTGSRLQDFCYPGDGEPAGVVERGLSQDVVAVIDELAEAVRVSLDASPGQRRDCRYACTAWERALRAHGIDVQLRGGEGVDDEVFVGYRLVPLNRRSGYRESDDQVHRHYWLEIGANGLIFDPTAHQFDDHIVGGLRPDHRHRRDRTPHEGGHDQPEGQRNGVRRGVDSRHRSPGQL